MFSFVFYVLAVRFYQTTDYLTVINILNNNTTLAELRSALKKNEIGKMLHVITLCVGDYVRLLVDECDYGGRGSDQAVVGLFSTL